MCQLQGRFTAALAAPLPDPISLQAGLYAESLGAYAAAVIHAACDTPQPLPWQRTRVLQGTVASLLCTDGGGFVSGTGEPWLSCPLRWTSPRCARQGRIWRLPGYGHVNRTEHDQASLFKQRAAMSELDPKDLEDPCQDPGGQGTHWPFSQSQNILAAGPSEIT